MTGHTGPSLVNSNYLNSSATGILGLGPTGTLLSTNTITVTQTCYLWATTTATFSNSSGSKYMLSIYMIVDGTTSNVTNSAIDSQYSGMVPAYTSITINQSTTAAVPPAQYFVKVYGYVNSGTNVLYSHIDTFVLGNLANTP